MKFGKKYFFSTLIAALVVTNVLTIWGLVKSRSHLELYQERIDVDFQRSLKSIATSLSQSTDWDTKFKLALSHASKVQILVDSTSFTVGTTEEAKNVLSYGYMLENYFQNSQHATIDNNPQELEEFIKCVEALSANPSDSESAKRLISLMK
ncbi:hypothetical protein HP567_006125 [Brevibacillus sp. M2.1A]|uniref:hypothetical protein n=1 Tax=Brevibacillus TaxID=55080 RepID=UPI00156B366F|nr:MULTISPECIES: hypothetical protein [Brevibacillus]MBY0083830.1 hypothetical protein [Brevibacillus brevis]MCC8434125.1 hypothetical protein [Brevibacillus sp. M2.1A]UKK96562.1 hypothetical protein FO446_03595 [Brevibacillus brevis]